MQAEAPIPGRGERVLLVDDEPSLVAVTTRRLRHLGYEITGETSPFMALERVRNAPHAFDVIVTDYAMPGINGIQLTTEAGRVRADLPVIMISGNPAWSDHDRCSCANLKRVLGKPVEIQDFALALREVLDR